MPDTPIYCAEPARRDTARRLSERYELPLVRQRPSEGYWLELGFERLALVTVGKQHGAVYAEFVQGAARHRRQQGGGRGQPVARAIGLKGASVPRVVDATAGLGRDAFVLASLGCQVTLVERSAVAAALLDDALARASVDLDIGEIAARMTLVHADAIDWLTHLEPDARPDVVYVDPMFPETGKSAAAKKDMQAFQHVIGDDLDSPRLLAAALGAARGRVVVKRPRLGAAIEGIPPSAQMDGKSTRFDIYSIKALKPSSVSD
jgi:16S rRNA (guanine1516-N2)-methyltransferase